MKTPTEEDWNIFLARIQDGKCTPFLGSGVNLGTLPSDSEIVQKWAQECSYPMKDSDILPRAAQFLAVDQADLIFPKEKIARMFKNIASPDFNEIDEPHGVLADLPFPIYITTNYDSFIVQALKSRNKEPKQELCLWNKYIKDQSSVFKSEPNFIPTPDKPVVFHLHGHIGLPESLVLTEDDYLDFLVNISRDHTMIPSLIQESITSTSLLFIGYRETDWNFRVLFRGLVSSMEQSLRRVNVAVMLPPPNLEKEQVKMQKYLTKYFEKTDVQFYWGTVREFANEIKERWRIFSSKC